MAKKFYAVKTGRTPGVYGTWADCKAQVDGYSGAVYKSFPTAAEALAFVTGETKQVERSGVVAYVEGIRGFIPASKLAAGYVENLEDWLNKKCCQAYFNKKRPVPFQKTGLFLLKNYFIFKLFL